MKNWYLSKTVWINVLMAVAAFLASPDVLNILPADVLKFVPAVQAAITVVLRVWFTNTTIAALAR